MVVFVNSFKVVLSYSPETYLYIALTRTCPYGHCSWFPL